MDLTNDDTTAYIINAANYKEGIPDSDEINHLIISDDLDQSLFRSFLDSASPLFDVNTRNFRCAHVILPKSMKVIKEEAFHDCDMMKTVTIPPILHTIEKNAFASCSNLESIELPKNLQYIGDFAFSDCVGLTEVIIPDSVKTLGIGVFCKCSHLQSVKFPESFESFSGERTFQDCGSLRSIIIPNNVTIIPEYTFDECSSLISIFIPNSLKAIGSEAFNDCNNLQNIAIPQNCNIADDAFDDCTKLDPILRIDGLQNRFCELPYHQLCYKHDISIIELTEIQSNDPLLHSVDDMSMTPLHILSCNPNATLDMIQVVASKCPIAALVRNSNNMTPIDLYFLTRSITLDHYFEDESHDIDDYPTIYNDIENLRFLLHRNSDRQIHEMIMAGVEYNVIEILLAFKGTSINSKLTTPYDRTGLYPLMTVATTCEYSLDDVYKIAMADPNVIRNYDVNIRGCKRCRKES
mmetsp:Transcript_9380/g.11859  ORF Transcript_9380/g.11859 Transcript_9380/m.11859 type:complete len:465 (+) Transcript_9380:280-1674(+)